MAILSSVVMEFEKQIRQYMAANFGKLDFSAPQYRLTRIGAGQYDITLNLSGFGTQHFSLTLVGDRFDISGKMALVGDNPNFPISLVAGMINNMVAKWVIQTTDTLATRDSNSIVQANSPAAAALPKDTPPHVPLVERIPNVTASVPK